MICPVNKIRIKLPHSQIQIFASRKYIMASKTFHLLMFFIDIKVKFILFNEI